MIATALARGSGINRIHDVARVVSSIVAPDLSIALLDVVDWGPCDSRATCRVGKTFDSIRRPTVEKGHRPRLAQLCGTAKCGTTRIGDGAGGRPAFARHRHPQRSAPVAPRRHFLPVSAKPVPATNPKGGGSHHRRTEGCIGPLGGDIWPWFGTLERRKLYLAPRGRFASELR